jgi:hypothetical protein
MINRGYSADIELLAAEINSSYVEQRSPHFDRGGVAAWVEAINLQMSIGQIDVAEHGLQHLRERFPTVTYANRIGDIFDQLPFAGTALPFKDDRERDVQVLMRDASKTALLLFCGYTGDLGLPLTVVHSWIGRLNASLIYLRDFRHRFFLDGVASLGSTRNATIAELHRIIASLGAKRIVCCGTSMGALGALHYGLDLGADAVLCLAGLVNLNPEFNAYTGYERRAIQMRAEMSDAPPDIVGLYNTAPTRPRVRFIYGADYWDDCIHAEYLASLPCVTLQPMENFGEHNVTVELIRRGQFEAVLHWLVPGSQTH